MEFIKKNLRKIFNFFRNEKTKQISLYLFGTIILSSLIFLGVFSYIKTKQAGPPPANAPWPMFMRDAQHTGKSPHLGPQTDNLQWRRTTGFEGKNFNQAVLNADGNKVYTGMGNVLHEIDTSRPYADYDRTFTAGTVIKTAPAISSEGIYFGCEDGTLYALDFANFNQKWSFVTGGSICENPYHCPSPTIGPDGTIYFASGNTFYAIEDQGDSYNVKWNVAPWGGVSNSNINSPAVKGEFVYYTISADSGGSTVAKLYKIKTVDGSVEWERSVGNSKLSSPAIDSDGNIYFGVDDGNFYSISPENAVNWQKSIPGFDFWYAPAIDNGKVYFTAYNNNGTPDDVTDDRHRLYGLNTTDGSELAVFPEPGSPWEVAFYGFYTSPIIDSAGAIYVGDWCRFVNRFRVTKYIYNESLSVFEEEWAFDQIPYNTYPRTPTLGNPGLGGAATLYIPLYNQAMIAIGPNESSLQSEKILPDSDVTLGEETSIVLKVRGKGTPPRLKNDIILVMDVSGSMGWDWGGQTKLDAAKQALYAFINKIEADPYNLGGVKYDKIGYVVYGKSGWNDVSEIKEPLTENYNAITTAIQETSDVGRGGTPIGSGLGLANYELGLSGEGGNGRDDARKIIVLATDGKQNTDPAVDQRGPLPGGYPDQNGGGCILKRSIDREHMVYTIGIGDDVTSINDLIETDPDCDWTVQRPLGAVMPGTCQGWTWILFPLPAHEECNEWKCKDPDYSGGTIFETGECLMQRIANYTGSGTGEDGNGYYFADNPEKLEDVYEEIAKRMNRRIVDSGETIIEERLESDMEYQGVEKIVHFDNESGGTREYITDEEIDSICILDESVPNGFNLTLKTALYIEDWVEIHFTIIPRQVGFSLPVDSAESKVRYTRIDEEEETTADVPPGSLTVRGGLQVIGDVHAKNNITIEGSATGVVTAGGGTVNILGDLATIAPYTINANTTADWVCVLSNINPKNIDRLKNERAKDFSSLGDDLNPDDTPEGGVWRETTALSLGIEGYTGRGTIIVEQGDLILGGDITVSGEGSMLGFIVENGNVIIQATVGELRRVAIFAPNGTPNGNIIIEPSPNSTTISGLLVAREIIIQRNNIVIEYDSRITGSIGLINGIPVIYHALPGFSQIIPPTWREGVP